MIRGKIHAAAYLARRRGRDRRAVSPGFAVGVRLGAGIGVNEEDCKQIIAILERDRLIDYVNVSIGDYFRMDTIVGGMHHPTGYQLASSADIASVASVPRLVTGRFRTLDEVAQVLRDGKADLVSMVRAVIADPELVRKTRRGAPIKCDRIACNQGCVGGLLRNGRLGCTVNPAVGTDLDLAESLSAWKRLASPLSRATRSPWSRRNRAWRRGIHCPSSTGASYTGRHHLLAGTGSISPGCRCSPRHLSGGCRSARRKPGCSDRGDRLDA